MWHIHRFTETERIFTGNSKGMRVEGNPEDVKRMVFGVTTIISSCCICGKLTTVEVLGDARKREDLPQ